MAIWYIYLLRDTTLININIYICLVPFIVNPKAVQYKHPLLLLHVYVANNFCLAIASAYNVDMYA